MAIQTDDVYGEIKDRQFSVYVSTDRSELNKLKQQFMTHIGGQNKVVCERHDMPLIHSVTKNKFCGCGEKEEELCCPDIYCDVCICSECLNGLPKETTTYINSCTQKSNFTNDDADYMSYSTSEY